LECCGKNAYWLRTVTSLLLLFVAEAGAADAELIIFWKRDVVFTMKEISARQNNAVMGMYACARREMGMLRPYAMEEEGTLSRTPLVDMVDRGDRYNLRLEIPGIDKDKIQLNATEDAIEISGEQSEEESNEDKVHNYIYNERSYRSFYRSIPIPEEILPSKICKNEQWYSSNRDSKESSEPACRREYKDRNTIVPAEQVPIIFFLFCESSNL
jgi:HSP20 family molecular chaperone IbpA